jgi:hypothetical protein
MRWLTLLDNFSKVLESKTRDQTTQNLSRENGGSKRKNMDRIRGGKLPPSFI